MYDFNVFIFLKTNTPTPTETHGDADPSVAECRRFVKSGIKAGQYHFKHLRKYHDSWCLLQ